MEYNNRVFDKWSLVHLGAGVGLGLIKVSRPWAYTILIGYEIVENVMMRKEMGDLFDEIEGPANAVSDVIVAGIGYEITRYLRSAKQIIP